MTPRHQASLDALAIFGGSPRFTELLHVGRPNIPPTNGVLDRMRDLLERRWLTNNGPVVRELESRIAELVGARHCIATCNGTIALEIAIRGLGLADEVIVPSFTFVATAHALQWQGITPVFADIDPLTHTLDAADVRRKITERTTGVIGVHTWGQPCAVSELEELAAEHGLTLLFDAAHAFGCSHDGVSIGNFGAAEVFSFHATKVFNTFEGGAVITNDHDLAGRLRLMKNFGFAGQDRVIHIGSNGKMAEPAAAMGLEGLAVLDHFIDVNRHNYERYRAGLDGAPGLRLRQVDTTASNSHYVVAEIDAAVSGITRDDIVRVLTAEGALVRRYFYPGAHRMEPYRTLYPQVHLPNTEAVAERVLVLPTGTAVSEQEITTLCELLQLITNRGKELSERLGEQNR